MPNYPASETNLQAEIDALRPKFQDTQDLYREACVVLFFRHGITPTANKLYQLVHKGSMSAPAEALNRFWATMREKSRIRIEHPDVPDALRYVAGELVGALWQRAQAAAHEALTQLQAEAQAQVKTAEDATQAANTRAQESEQSLHVAQQKLQLLQQQWTDSQTDLGRAQGMVNALQRQVDAGVMQRRELQEGFTATQQRFSHELEQQRTAAHASEVRHTSDLKRLLLDIDRERVNASRLQKELEQTRRTFAEQTELQRQELQDKQQALDILQRHNRELEGNAGELRGQRDQLNQQLDELQIRLKTPLPTQVLTSRPLKRRIRNAQPSPRIKQTL